MYSMPNLTQKMHAIKLWSCRSHSNSPSHAFWETHSLFVSYSAFESFLCFLVLYSFVELAHQVFKLKFVSTINRSTRSSNCWNYHVSIVLYGLYTWTIDPVNQCNAFPSDILTTILKLWMRNKNKHITLFITVYLCQSKKENFKNMKSK